MYGSLDVSASGLIAQRTRLTTIAQNLLHQNTILDENGEYAPYRRRIPIFAVGDPTSGDPRGVHVASIEEDDGPLMARFEPENPFADADGYVYYPNVDPVIEQTNALEAMRAYEANITAIETTKSMLNAALRLLA